jgi:hypothetical protein
MRSNMRAHERLSNVVALPFLISKLEQVVCTHTLASESPYMQPIRYHIRLKNKVKLASVDLPETTRGVRGTTLSATLSQTAHFLCVTNLVVDSGYTLHIRTCRFESSSFSERRLCWLAPTRACCPWCPVSGRSRFWNKKRCFCFFCICEKVSSKVSYGEL